MNCCLVYTLPEWDLGWFVWGLRLFWPQGLPTPLDYQISVTPMASIQRAPAFSHHEKAVHRSFLPETLWDTVNWEYFGRDLGPAATAVPKTLRSHREGVKSISLSWLHLLDKNLNLETAKSNLLLLLVSPSAPTLLRSWWTAWFSSFVWLSRN